MLNSTELLKSINTIGTAMHHRSTHSAQPTVSEQPCTFQKHQLGFAQILQQFGAKRLPVHLLSDLDIFVSITPFLPIFLQEHVQNL